MERAALHSYYTDPWTEEDYEVMGIPSGKSADDGMAGIELSSLRNDDVMYDGGHAHNNNSNDGGIMSALCCWKKQDNTEKDTKEGPKFGEMTND
jgi:hypothetical protein